MTNTITTQTLDTFADEELLIAQELLYRYTPLLDEDLTSETLAQIRQLENSISARFSNTTPATRTAHKHAA